MPRLPDIPLSSWIADQQDKFQDRVSGLLPALEFSAAAQEAEAEIPGDWPNYGTSPEQEEARLAEEQRRLQEQQEQERRQQEEAQRQQMLLQWQQQQQEQERLRQEEIAVQAQQQVQELGIPTPEDAAQQFGVMEAGGPGAIVPTRDPMSTNLTGAEEYGPTPQSPPVEPGLGDPMSGLGYTPDPATVNSIDDFSQFASSLGESVWGATGKRITDAFQSGVVDPLTTYGEPALNAATGMQAADIRLEEARRKAGLPEAGSYPLGLAPKTGLPEEREAENATRDAITKLTDFPMKLTQDWSNALSELIVPGTERRKLDVSGGLGDAVGVGKIGIGDIVPQVANGPGKILGLMQLAQIGGQLVDAPVETAGGLAVLGALAKWGPKYPARVIGAVGALAGGIDAALNERDVTGGGSDYWDVGAEAAAGGAAGYGGVKAIGSFGRTIKKIAASETAREALRNLDLEIGRVYDQGKSIFQELGVERPVVSEQSNFMAAGKMPMTPEGSPGTRRMVHGGTVGNDDIDPKYFKEYGEFGPAYYMSSAPETGEAYFDLAGSRLDVPEGGGAVLRPHDLDDRARLFHAEKPVPQREVRDIYRAMARLHGDDPNYQGLIQDYQVLSQMSTPEYRRYQQSGKDFYNSLASELGQLSDDADNLPVNELEEALDKRGINRVLSEAGYDGIYYEGERLYPDSPNHDAVGIFPDKLDVFRNALTGEVAQRAGTEGENTKEARRFLYDVRSNREKLLSDAAKLNTGLGAVSGGVAGAATTPEDASPMERTGRILAGVGAGTLTGLGASDRLAKPIINRAAKYIAEGLNSGFIPTEVRSSHPDDMNRVKAMLLLAARDYRNDQNFRVPGAVLMELRNRTSFAPEMQQSLERILGIPGDVDPNEVYAVSAGTVRREFSSSATSPVEGIGKAAREFMVDYLGNTNFRQSRSREANADRFAVRGWEGREAPTSNRDPVPSSDPDTYWNSNKGNPVTEISDEGVHAGDPKYQGVRSAVQGIARELGIRGNVRVLAEHSPAINASAFRGSGHDPVVVVHDGFIEAWYRGDISDHEFEGTILHELGHATDADSGVSLLTEAKSRFRELRNRMAGGTPRAPKHMSDMMEYRRSVREEEAAKARALADDPVNPQEPEFADDDFQPLTSVADDFEPLTSAADEPLAQAARTEEVDVSRLRLFDTNETLSPETVDSLYAKMTPDMQEEVDLLLDAKPQVTGRDLYASMYEGSGDDEAAVRAVLESAAYQGVARAGEPPTVFGRPLGETASRTGDVPDPANPRIPKNGPWADRLAQGPQIPEDMPKHLQAQAQRFWNEAMRLLDKSQTESKQAKKMRFWNEAENAWKKYDEQIAPFDGRPAPEPEVPVASERRVRIPRETGPRTPKSPETTGPAEDTLPAFEPEPLPTELDPKRPVDKEELSQFVKQMQATLAADPASLRILEGSAMRLMGMDKIRGRHLQQVLEFIGTKRAVGRSMTKEAEGAQWADKWLRDNGWLAPREAAGAGDAVPGYRPPTEGVTPELGERPSGLVDDVSRVQNLNSAGGAALGAAGGGLTDELGQEDEDDVSLERLAAGAFIGGVFGRKKPLKALLNDPVLNNSPAAKMFMKPNQPSPLTNLGAFERIAHEWRTKVIPAISDDLAALQGFQNDMAKEFKRQTGRLLPANVMAAELKRFNPDRAAEMVIKTKLKPILQGIEELGVPQAQVDEYLLYNQQIDIINQQSAAGVSSLRPLPGGGNKGTALTAIRNLETKWQTVLTAPQYQQLKQHIQAAWDLGDHVLQVRRDAGLIDDETYRVLRATYPRYVPTKILKYMDDPENFSQGKSLSILQNGIKKLTYDGTVDDAASPLAALASQVYESYAASHKNEVARSLMDLWMLAQGDPTQGFTGVRGRSDYLGRRIERTIAGFNPIKTGDRPRENANSFTFFLDGEPFKLEVDKTLGDMTKFQPQVIIPVISGLVQAFKAGATSRNPVFLTANAFLDWTSFMQKETARDKGNFPRVMTEWAKAMHEFVPIYTGAGGIAGGIMGAGQIEKDDSNWERAAKVGAGIVGGGLVGAGLENALPGRSSVWRDIARGEYSGDMRRFLEQGGGMSGAYTNMSLKKPTQEGTRWLTPGGTPWDFDGFMKAIGRPRTSAAQQHLDELTRPVFAVDNFADFMRVVKDTLLLKPVEAIGERIELAPRVAAMRLAERRVMRDAGPGALLQPDAVQRARIEGTQAGRTTTLDFSKGGIWTRAVNQIVPFFNVGVQSVADIPRSIQQNPVGYPAAALMSTMIPVMAAEVWNQHDPQIAKDYADVPDYIKDQGLVLMLPTEARVDAQGNRRPDFIHIRYRQLAPVAIMTREMMQRVFYADKVAAEQNRRSLVDSFFAGGNQIAPIQAWSEGDSAGQTAGNLLQGLIPPGISTAVQLHDKVNYDFFRDAKIDTKYGNERATPLSKGLAAATGIGTPAQWEFGTRDIGAGYAGMLHGASEILAGDLTDESKPTPFVGGLQSRFAKASIGGQANRAADHTITPSAENILKKANVSWRPGEVSPEIKKIPLTRTELAQYQNLMNKATDDTIQELSRDPMWDSLSVAEKEHWIQTVLGRYRDRVQRTVLSGMSDAEMDRRLEAERVKRSK